MTDNFASSPDDHPVPHNYVRAENPRGQVLFAPAMGTPASFYQRLALPLAATGYSCTIMELRGIGRSPIRAGRDRDFGYSHLVQDYMSLAGELRASRPDLPLIAGGHSLGGHLALMAAAQNQAFSDRLLLVASGTPFFRLYRKRQQIPMRAVPPIGNMLARLLGYFPGKRLGFMGNEARTLFREWGVLVKSNRFETQDEIDYQTAMSEMRVRIVSFSLATDNLTPPASTSALVERCTGSNVVHRVLENEQLGFEATHFNWVKHAENFLPFVLPEVED